MPEIINLRSLFLVFFNRIPELNHNHYIIQKKRNERLCSSSINICVHPSSPQPSYLYLPL